MKYTFLVITILLISSYCQPFSGVNVGLLPSAIDKVKNTYLPLVSCKLAGTQIPSSSYLSYQFTNTVIQSVSIDPAQTNITLNDGFIQVSSSNINMIVQTQYSQSQGTESTETVSPTIITVNASNVDLSFMMNITATPDGKPSIQVFNTTASAQYIDVANATGYIKRIGQNYNNDFNFKNSANQKIASLLQSGLQDVLNNYTNQYPVIESISPVDDRIKVDNRLVRNPLITSKFIAFYFNETFFVENATCPAYDGQDFVPIPSIETNQTTQEFQLYLSDYSLNTALYSFWCAGLLKVQLPSQLQGFNIPFTNWYTDNFTDIIPPIVATYGSNVPVSINCNNVGGTQPDIRSTPLNLEAIISGACQIGLTVNDVYNQILDFVGNMSMNGNLLPQPDNQLTLNASSVNVQDLNISSSTIPGLDNVKLKDFFGGLISQHVPYSQNVSLPITDYVSLKDSVVNYNPGYIQVLSSADFVPINC